jgi:DNA-directed RNA polymerase sigma subunit (sigma70/sigma32)
MRAKRLTTQQRQEIFYDLVATQDLGLMTVAQSLQHVMKKYDITESQLRQIEDEGIDKEWPPLDRAAQPVADAD